MIIIHPLGGCLRRGILAKIEKFSENKHSHIINIGVFAYLRALFYDNSEEFEQKAILGQPPSVMTFYVDFDANR